MAGNANSGRKLMLDEKKLNIICAALASGQTRKGACAAAQISETTFYRWMEEGRSQESGIFRKLRDSVDMAENEAELQIIDVLWKKAMKGDMKAIRQWLHARRPDTWGDKTRQEIGVQLGGEVVVTLPASLEPDYDNSYDGDGDGSDDSSDEPDS